MEAKIYQLDDMRSQQRSRLLMEKLFPKSMVLDGWALMYSATSFLVVYWRHMASYHAHILSAYLSGGSTLPQDAGKR